MCGIWKHGCPCVPEEPEEGETMVIQKITKDEQMTEMIRQLLWGTAPDEEGLTKPLLEDITVERHEDGTQDWHIKVSGEIPPLPTPERDTLWYIRNLLESVESGERVVESVSFTVAEVEITKPEDQYKNFSASEIVTWSFEVAPAKRRKFFDVRPLE